MTPKEKADQLIDKMYYIGRYDDKEDYNPAMAWERAKQCALIAVDEIIYVAQYECHAPRGYNPHETVEYWEEVKQEIENL